MNEAEMVESKGIHEIVNQATVQVVTKVVMVLRHRCGTLTSFYSKPRRATVQRHGGPALEKPSFNWHAQERYGELLNFEMDATNTL